MASITPGDQGTLKSTTVENTVLEAAMLLQSIELNSARNQSGANNVSLNFNSDNATISISIDLPVEQALDASGQIVLKAKEYTTDL